MKILLSAAAASALCATAAFAVDQCSDGCRLALLRDPDAAQMRMARDEQRAAPPRRPEKPRYRESRQAVFVRGGYVFAAGGSGLADGEGVAAYGAGYRRYFDAASRFSVEVEAAYLKDSDPVTIGVGLETATLRYISGLASLRWDGPKFGAFTPFVSGGFGPTQVKTRLDDGVTPLEDADFGLGYVGRLGVSAPLFKAVSVEAGYRFYGATNDAAVNTHAAELGLVYRF
jgi:opacity protein-like surface antigen